MDSVEGFVPDFADSYNDILSACKLQHFCAEFCFVNGIIFIGCYHFQIYFGTFQNHGKRPCIVNVASDVRIKDEWNCFFHLKVTFQGVFLNCTIKNALVCILTEIFLFYIFLSCLPFDSIIDKLYAKWYNSACIYKFL